MIGSSITHLRQCIRVNFGPNPFSIYRDSTKPTTLLTLFWRGSGERNSTAIWIAAGQNSTREIYQTTAENLKRSSYRHGTNRHAIPKSSWKPLLLGEKPRSAIFEVHPQQLVAHAANQKNTFYNLPITITLWRPFLSAILRIFGSGLYIITAILKSYSSSTI